MYDFQSAFEYQAILPIEDVTRIINYLITTEDPYIGGSSFAVTSENYDSKIRTLYMTKTSYDRVVRLAIGLPSEIGKVKD